MKICCTLAGAEEKDILSEIESMDMENCDIIEWRADFYEKAQELPALILILEKIRKAIGEKPLIFTLRTEEEGGSVRIDGKKYFDIVKAAIESGFIDIIDMEYSKNGDGFRHALALAKEKGVSVIGSRHIFHKTPEICEMQKVIREIQEDTDIAKLAVFANSLEDTQRVIRASELIKQGAGGDNENKPFILIAMGEKGRETRRTDRNFGSCITYAAGRHSTAPGQFSLEELIKMREKKNEKEDVK